jgi:hypothetical protein
MLKPRTAPRETVRRVLVKHRRQVKVITIDDTGEVFTRMNINALVMGYGKPNWLEPTALDDERADWRSLVARLRCDHLRR